MDRSEEQVLVDRAVGGEEEAWRVLFGRYLRLLEARARKRLPPSLRRRVSVTDVLQETRLIAYRRLARFEPRGEGSFGSYLLGILELKIREMIRHHVEVAKRSSRREVTRGFRPDTGQFRGHTDSPSVVAMREERRNALRAALSDLPEDYREILRLTHFEQLSLAEAGEHMGRSREAAKKLHARALAQLGSALRTGFGRDPGIVGP